MLLSALLENRKLCGALLGLVVFGVVYFLTTLPGDPPPSGAAEEEEEEEREAPRDFTLEQLREFDGIKSDKIYVAMKGDVFDVSSNRGMYGSDGSYGFLAGRDASRCLAKMSLEASDLDGSIEDLSVSESDALDEWHTTFKHVKCYPRAGRLSTPPPPETRLSLADLGKCLDQTRPPPPGRLQAPLLVAVRGIVYDVSYGGVDHYGPKGPYYKFCGRDASRALAKMSLDPSDIDDTTDLSDLSDKEVAILDDWEKLFKRKYPAVGVVL